MYMVYMVHMVMVRVMVRFIVIGTERKGFHCICGSNNARIDPSPSFRRRRSVGFTVGAGGGYFAFFFRGEEDVDMLFWLRL